MVASRCTTHLRSDGSWWEFPDFHLPGGFTTYSPPINRGSATSSRFLNIDRSHVKSQPGCQQKLGNSNSIHFQISIFSCLKVIWHQYVLWATMLREWAVRERAPSFPPPPLAPLGHPLESSPWVSLSILFALDLSKLDFFLGLAFSARI